MGGARPELYKMELCKYSVGEAPIRTLCKETFFIYSAWDAPALNYIRGNSSYIV